jgi:hypothetical protein
VAVARKLVEICWILLRPGIASAPLHSEEKIPERAAYCGRRVPKAAFEARSRGLASASR